MANDDLIDAFPLQAETPESILARLLADINAGVDPTDPAYADTIPGSVWDDMNRSAQLEFDRLYDRMLSEVPAQALPLTATGAWLDAWASVARLQRKTATQAAGTVRFVGTADTPIPNQVSVAAPAPVPGGDPIVFQTTQAAAIPHAGVNYVDVPAQALVAGSAGNVPANTVTLLESEIDGITNVTNQQPMTGGSDIETDEALQERVDEALNAAPGAGNVDYYAILAKNFPGVGFVTVQPNTPNVGHVTIVIADINNNPMPAGAIATFQAQVDPGTAPGAGYGEATIGATVTVTTPALENETIAAQIQYQPGYSVDGAGGSIALGGPITTAVENYVNRLPVAPLIVYNKLLAAIIDVPGVANVLALSINGTAADHQVAAGKVATVVAVNLT